MTSSTIVDTWKRQYLVALANHGNEQLAAKAANVGMSKVLYFRRINEDFREAEQRAKEDFRSRVKTPISW